MPRIGANGIGLSYELHGSGDPVLLVCGTGQPAFSWSPFQIPALTGAGYQVVTFDNRGVDPSDVPPPPYSVDDMVEDTAELIEGLGIGACRVAGLSLGAFITQELALSRPDLVRGAAMMGTLGRLDVFRRVLFESWVELDESGVELPHLYEAVSVSFSLFAHHTLNDDDAMDLYIEATTSMPQWSGPGRLGQHSADASYSDRLESLAEVSVPSLVIGFELDMITPVHLCREVARAIPGCHYVEIPDTGHSGPFEKPNEVNAALLEFFSGV